MHVKPSPGSAEPVAEPRRWRFAMRGVGYLRPMESARVEHKELVENSDCAKAFDQIV